VRRAARLDANHRTLVRFFLAHGCSWLDLAKVGKGCPDGLLGWNRRSCLVEFKSRGPQGGMSSGASRSAIGQAEWAASWRGCPVYVVDGVEAAQAVLEHLRG
jgi:hypothetical protein